MPICIRIADGALAGSEFAFPDAQAAVTVGRHPSCDVVYPADDVRVSRYHLAFERKLARYRLVMQADNPVWVDGEEAFEGDELPLAAKVALGHPDGPTLLVETTEDDDLPPTERYARHASPGQLAEKAERISRAVRRLSLFLAVAVAAVVAVGLWAAMEGRRSQADLAAAVENATLGSQFEEELAAQLRQAAASVYLVAVQDEMGLTPLGTAWVAAPGVLATSAHVADAFLKMDGVKLVVRASGTPVRDFAVTGIDLHPQFHPFEQAWRRYGPIAAGVGGDDRVIAEAGAYDVALLRVAPAEAGKLAPPLVIATDAELRALEPGHLVGYVGFPVESAALGGINPDDPEAQLQIGRLTALTDFFLVKSAPADRQLLQHTLPVQGGASGAPVFDRHGRVVGVLSGGNLVEVVPNGVRVPSGIGVNFAQRADLLRELLAGGAEAKAGERETYWQQRLKRYRTEADLALRDWASGHGTTQPPVPVLQTSGHTAYDRRYDMAVFVQPYLLGQDGWYLFQATAQGRAAPDMMVVEETRGGPKMLGINASANRHPGVELNGDKGAALKVVVAAPAGAEVNLRVFWLPVGKGGK